MHRCIQYFVVVQHGPGYRQEQNENAGHVILVQFLCCDLIADHRSVISDQWSVIQVVVVQEICIWHMIMIIWSYDTWDDVHWHCTLYNCSSFLGCQPGYRYGQHRNAGACCVLLDHKYMYMYHLSCLCQDMGGSWIGWIGCVVGVKCKLHHPSHMYAYAYVPEFHAKCTEKWWFYHKAVQYCNERRYGMHTNTNTSNAGWIYVLCTMYLYSTWSYAICIHINTFHVVKSAKCKVQRGGEEMTTAKSNIFIRLYKVLYKCTGMSNVESHKSRNRGWTSADRSTKATLMLTVPRSF